MTRTIAIIILIAAAFSSCTPGKKLATQFVMTEGDLNVLLLPPPGLIKKYYSENPFAESSDTLTTDPLKESSFIGELNDTAFVNYYLRSLKYHLEMFQVNVYGPDQLDSFLQIDTVAYIFSMAQIELMEYVDEHVDTTVLDTLVYRASFPRDNVEKSTWFEFTELNNPDRPMEVLYSMQRTSDYYDGKFYYEWQSGELTYRYSSFDIESADVYDLAYFAGQKNAQYIFDYLMNLYVRENSKRPPGSDNYYQYDNERHAIRRAFNDRFIVMPSQQQPSAN